jgi:tRNA nucleotidyltransferase/poly(A) polymerase
MWYGSSRADDARQFMASLPVPEVYRVGGSVRDELLGRHSKDSDYMVRGARHARPRGRHPRRGCRPTTLKLRDGRVVGSRFTLPVTA